MRSDYYGMTVLELSGSVGQILLQIHSRLSPRQRRAIALSFFRQIKPWLKYFSQHELHHTESGHAPKYSSAANHDPLLKRSPGINDPLRHFGYDLRMKRLEFGLTQDELARMVGTNRCRISLIERGMSIPRKTTMKKLSKILRADLETIPMT